jgi:hypothetical protein
MRIAVQLESDGAGSEFFQECFYSLVQQQPAVQVLFLVNKTFAPKRFDHPNIQYLAVKRNISAGLTRYFWCRFQLPSILRKQKIDCFCNSHQAVRLPHNVRQVVFVNNALLTPRSIQKYYALADYIIVNSQYQLEYLTKHIDRTDAQVACIRQGIHSRNPMERAAKESLKEQKTQGKDFFYFDYARCQKESLLIVLKAFSIFKKWQQSNVQLLINANPPQFSYAEQLCANYLHKSDLVFVDSSKEPMTDLMGAAYAYIGMSEEAMVDSHLLQALSYSLPLVLPSSEHLKSYFGEAVLYTQKNEKDLSRLMMLLYKDEMLRNHLVRQCQAFKQMDSWEQAAQHLWKTINHEKKS